MEQEEQMWNSKPPKGKEGLWRMMQESWDKREKEQVPVKPFTMDDWTELCKALEERNIKNREETGKYWPDISLWPKDLPKGVYQGSIAGVRGYYSTKFRDQLKEAAKREYNATQKESNEKESNQKKDNSKTKGKNS